MNEEVVTSEKVVYKRSLKNFFVNKEIQFAIINYFILIFTGICACNLGIIYYFWNRYADAWQSLGMETSNTFSGFLSANLEVFTSYTMVFSFALLIFFVFDWMKFSHRIVGPIYNLEKHIQRMLDDENFEKKDVIFRDGDKFQELADVFNKLMARVKEDEKK